MLKEKSYDSRSKLDLFDFFLLLNSLKINNIVLYFDFFQFILYKLSILSVSLACHGLCRSHPVHRLTDL